nr:BREX-1 system adenine-specific DNA-methyltransferase PglX [uncultured Sphaerochaeta sp.]
MKKINKYLYRVTADDFQKIPGSPIAYWVSDKIFTIFQNCIQLKTFSKGSTGLQTSNSDKFLRFWQEINKSSIHVKWMPFAKGGGYRKWYGNVEHLVNWDDNGKDVKTYVAKKYPYLKGNYGLVVKNENTYFLKGVLTSRITSGKLAFRIKASNEIYSDACTAIFPNDSDFFLSLLSSKLLRIIEDLNPTINFQASDIEKFPILTHALKLPISDTVNICLSISQSDWDSYETSWDFTSLPLLDASYRGDTLASTYSNLRAHWNDLTLEMQRLEEENNRIFIEAYGLEDELTPDVPLKEITLTCNPYYRYGDNKSDSELEELLLADTMKELISYAVGCMFGRYSLDKPGLILANQGETYEDYCRLVPGSSFPADEDNAIPVLDGDWFSDDIVMRFRKFLRVAFGEEKYEENLRFVEKALGKDLRQYFLKDFYNDHVRRYKKRPIYWMFSSPDGSFNVLIYMHRYRPDTASIVLNEYLREYQVKLSSYMESLRRKEGNPDLSKGEKTKALKELDKLRKTQDILATYERDVLFPLANQRIEIDLDDGVKVNYPKFGTALKKVPGLEAKE